MSTSTKAHTPGPWKVAYYGNTIDDLPAWNIAQADHVGNLCQLALVATGDDGRQDMEAAANARLIAQAPAMYEALERLASEIASDDWDGQTIREIGLDAAAILAAVRGE